MRFEIESKDYGNSQCMSMLWLGKRYGVVEKQTKRLTFTDKVKMKKMLRQIIPNACNYFLGSRMKQVKCTKIGARRYVRKSHRRIY